MVGFSYGIDFATNRIKSKTISKLHAINAAKKDITQMN